MKKIVVALLLIVLLAFLSSCTLYTEQVGYDSKTNSYKRVVHILPELDDLIYEKKP